MLEETVFAGSNMERTSIVDDGIFISYTGLDLEGMTIPTTTEGVNWYDDAYVCTATWAYVVE